MQQPIMTSNQYRSPTRKIIRSIEKQYRIVPLNSLKNRKYCLKVPVYITTEFDKDNVIAIFDDIEAFAYADTVNQDKG